MKTKKIKLPDSFVNKLVNLPESGMGYQIVKVMLKGGKVLRRQKVLNSELLMLENNETLLAQDIVNVELDA